MYSSSLSLTSEVKLLAIARAPSNAPVALKTQQEPHCPWSMTCVTAFFAVQSIDAGSVAFFSSSALLVQGLVLLGDNH